MTNQPLTPRVTIDQGAVRTHLHTARLHATPTSIWTALADIPVLLAEVDRLARLLSRTRWDFANLLAAGRATLAADHDGEPDPLSYLRDQVAEHRAFTPPEDGELVA